MFSTILFSSSNQLQGGSYLNRWFVVHDLLAYSQHEDMIGNVVKAPGLKQPKYPAFAEIQKGDHIVYYATQDSVIVGIFAQ